MQETWEAMEKLVADGLVKSIGVSNFTIANLQDLLKHAKIIPAVNQGLCIYTFSYIDAYAV